MSDRETGMQQAIERVSHAANTAARNGSIRVTLAASDAHRLIEAANENAALRRQLAEARHQCADADRAVASARRERDTAIAQVADLRRQLAEAPAQRAGSTPVVERRRGDLLIAPEDFEFQPPE
jgi:septal ring factor EnvC (AmiA/AmiB activator)